MRLELESCHVEIIPALWRLVERKLARLERILNDSALSAEVVLTNQRRARRADVTLHTLGEKFRHAVCASKDASIVDDRLGKAFARQACFARAERVRPRMPGILEASRQELRAMPVAPGCNMGILVEVAARNQLRRARGHHAALALGERLEQTLGQSAGPGWRDDGVDDEELEQGEGG